jgi:hypothetical protein
VTGFEILGAVLIVGMLTGAITASNTESDTATKSSVCLVCADVETSREMDIDAVTEPNLNENDVTPE